MPREDGMEKFSYKKGQWYKVRFYDHVMGEDKHVTCKLYGYVVKSTKLSVTFSWWECEDMDLKEDNQELVTLLRSTIFEASALE